MSSDGSSGLLTLVFWCVAFVAFLLWSFNHLEFPW
jgi:hypothetical protein